MNAEIFQIFYSSTTSSLQSSALLQSMKKIMSYPDAFLFIYSIQGDGMHGFSYRCTSLIVTAIVLRVSDVMVLSTAYYDQGIESWCMEIENHPCLLGRIFF